MSSDYFRTYLKTIRDTEQIADQESDGAVIAVRLLRNLGDTGSEELARFQTTAGLSFSRFSEIVGVLKQAHLVDVSGDPGSERIVITPAGQVLADLK